MCVDDARVGLPPGLRLVPPVRTSVLHHREMTFEVDPCDRVELFLGRRDDHAVAHEPGVVHQHIQAAERINRPGDDPGACFPVRDVVGVRDRGATHRFDLAHHVEGRSFIGPRPVEGTAEVVYDDKSTLPRERERMFAADPPTRSRDNDDATFANSHADTLCADLTPRQIGSRISFTSTLCTAYMSKRGHKPWGSATGGRAVFTQSSRSLHVEVVDVAGEAGPLQGRVETEAIEVVGVYTVTVLRVVGVVRRHT